MRRRRLLLCVAPLVTLVALAVPATAHTQVRRATPGPAEVVEAPVREVVLEFLDPVLPTPTIEVTDAGGLPVPGQGEVRLEGDDVARVAVGPIEEPGEYQVDYAFVALDGATQDGAHRFTVTAAEGPAVELRPLLGWAVGGVLVALLGAALLGRRRSQV